MEIKRSVHPEHAKEFNSEELRNKFLMNSLFHPNELNLVYSHIDRIIVGGVTPLESTLALEVGKEIGADYFLERRELGLINVGGEGSIRIDGQSYDLGSRDGLYIGKGAEEVEFSSADSENPAKFYLNSAPAHKHYPTVEVSLDKAKKLELGSLSNSNKRTIYQYVHPEILDSCQLVMGLTMLETNNVWNTMPTHTHDRRMEVYFYLDVPENDVVFHLIGEPDETRHIVVRDEEAVMMPSWSIHSGVGTSNYSFIWGMVGENQEFDDMDDVPMSELK